jgi:hypothetical protein
MSTKRTRKPNNRSSIYRGADGLWHGRVTMGVKNDGSPDRRHRTGKTETEVTEKVRKLEQLRDGGKATKPGRPPKLAEWMATYLDVICENLVSSGQMSPRSLDDYRSKNRNWIEPKLGGHRLDRLLPDHLDVAYSEMYEAGLSSSTVLKIHRIISRALTVAVRRGKIGRNVASREHYGDAPEAVDTEMVPFTQAEARLVLDAAKGRRNAARWSVALSLGLRQGEALGLRWSYVDLETGVVRAWFQSAGPTGGTAATMRVLAGRSGTGRRAPRFAESTGTAGIARPGVGSECTAAHVAPATPEPVPGTPATVRSDTVAVSPSANAREGRSSRSSARGSCYRSFALTGRCRSWSGWPPARSGLTTTSCSPP